MRPRRALILFAALLLAAVPLEAREATAQTGPVSDVRTLARIYGDPPGTDYARLRIPALGVDAPVGARRVGGGESILPSPYGPADVAWYDLSDWYGLGGAPGAGGNAIFSGHVDYAARVPYAGVRYHGQGVFAGLKTLQPGDLVEVVYQGRTLRYAVTWRQQLDAQTADWASVFSSDVPRDSITLFTCGGTFDRATLDYSDRFVVRAERVLGSATRLPPPEAGGFVYGRAGTNHVESLVAAQRFEVAAVYAFDVRKGWLSYIPGGPAFANTLSGSLDPEAYVILKRR
jgi:hypothetical protein